MIKVLRFVCIMMAVTGFMPVYAQQISPAENCVLTVSQLKPGDLLFVINNKGNAITDVTNGYHGKQIDHVAFVINNKGMIAEATTRKGVGLTDIRKFMDHGSRDSCRSEFLVGRVNIPYSWRKTLRNYRRYEHLPYDSLFMPDDKAMYCSELVQKCYVDAKGKRIFNTIPMSFHNKKGEITDFWKMFYSRKGLKVPEGEPGTNPGQLSRDEHVTIIGYLK